MTVAKIQASIQNADDITYNQEFDNGNSGAGTVTIDWRKGNKQKLTLTGSCTIAFTAPAGVCHVQLRLIQGGAGSFTVTWPTEGVAAGNLAWIGKAAPTLTTAVGAIDIMSIFYNGSFYMASYGLNFG